MCLSGHALREFEFAHWKYKRTLIILDRIKKYRPYNIVRLRNNRRVFVIIKRLLYRLMIKITFGNTIQYCVYLKTPANRLDKKVYQYCYLIEIRIEIRFRFICSICPLEFQCCFNLFKEKLLLAIYLYVEHFSYNLQ